MTFRHNGLVSGVRNYREKCESMEGVSAESH